MKLYIAASSKELDRAERWIARAKEAGFVITFDWTVPIRQKGSGNTLPFEEKRKYATIDMKAIREAQAFWLLLPRDHVSFGAVWEFGFATGLDHAEHRMDDRTDGYVVVHPMNVLVSGPREDAHIFTTLADAMFEEDEDAFEHLLRCRED